MHEQFIDMVQEVRKRNPEYAQNFLDISERDFFFVIVIVGLALLWFMHTNSEAIVLARKNIASEFRHLNKNRVDDTNWERLTL
jgi:hypothetical protein